MADFRLGMRVRVNHTMPYPTNWDITGTVEVIPGQALGKIRRHRSDWLGVRFDDGEIVEWFRGYFDPIEDAAHGQGREEGK